MFGTTAYVLFTVEPWIERWGRLALGPTERRIFGVICIFCAVAIAAEGLFARESRLQYYLDRLFSKE